jgi:hypothetical protein
LLLILAKALFLHNNQYIQYITDTMLRGRSFLLNMAGKSQLRSGMRSVRAFSSPSPQKEESKEESQMEKYKPQLTQAVILGGIGITIYGLSSFMWDVTYGMFCNDIWSS